MSDAAAAPSGPAPSQQSDSPVVGGVPPQKAAAPVVHDDPEIEFDGIGKFKRSELAKRLKGQAELERESTRRFQEGARARKEAEAILAELDADPRAVMTKRKIDAVKWAEQVLTDELKMAQMSPGDRRAMHLEQENAQLKEQDKLTKAEKEKQAADAEVSRQEVHFDKLLGQAIADSGLPKTPRTIARAAELAAAHLQNETNVSREEFVQQLRDELDGDSRVRISGLKGAELIKWLGPELIEEVRKHFLATVGQQQVKQPQTGSGESRSRERKLMTREELHARLDQRI